MTNYLRLALILFAFAAVSHAKDFQKAAPLRDNPKAQKWAKKQLRKLSLEEKIGQMFMVRAYSEFLNVASPEYLRFRDELRRYHIGSVLLTVRLDGPFLLKSEPYEAAMFTNRLQKEAKLPLLFAADFERGLSQRFNGPTVFPHAMAFGAAGNPEYAEKFGEVVARESRAVGVHWNFFPVADVNSNPANPIINTRAFSEEQKQVSDLTVAYIRGARNAGMLTTAKHFPGHGDTSTDSHLEMARVDSDKAHLESVELAPFRSAIEAGVDSIMIAHVTVPALDPDPKRGASTSPVVIKDLLQSKLGFKGLIVPDALEMMALTRLFSDGKMTTAAAAGRAAVETIKAGNDMILIPPDLEGAYNGLVEAARSGEIPMTQIDASVQKILAAKATMGLQKARLVDIEALDEILAAPESIAFASSVAESAVTLVRDNRKVLPLYRPGGGTNRPGLPYVAPREGSGRTLLLLFSDDLRGESGRTLEREMRARNADLRVMYIDSRVANAMTDQVLNAVSQAQSVVAAVYLVPTAGRVTRVQGVLQSSAAMSDAASELMRRVIRQAGEKTVVLAMGTPYIASSFPEIQTYICTFSHATVAESAAVKALYGEIEIRGRLPVSIPGIAPRGTGLTKPAVTAASAPAPANR